MSSQLITKLFPGCLQVKKSSLTLTWDKRLNALSGDITDRSIIFFSIFVVVVGRKTLSIFGKKNCTYEKKSSQSPFFRHPAASPETNFFLDWPDLDLGQTAQWLSGDITDRSIDKSGQATDNWQS